MNTTWQDAFDEHHQFDVYPDHFMTGLRNEFCAGWHAALKSGDRHLISDAALKRFGQSQYRDGYAQAAHEFKNFHRLLCERFGYVHDDEHWRRDQLSLIEWIAAMMPKPRFPETFCSSCGKSLGAGDSGVSHCGDHK